MNRFRDAVNIQKGACNLRAISRSLVDACDNAAIEGTNPAEDPAVRLIIQKMYFLCKGIELDTGILEYDRCMTYCEERANS